ncbi:hypothetical protein U2F26_28100 [Micromonospora sp. 4G57]|uniref:Uncharacterized protein n=1 Tax=Micromonospora sicca TaxID=2202420 RepID=A0ABU5JNQ1_9ACTN|nr:MULTISPECIES: hypothetical protein [unclassified Micromonospora]MDZ5446539.1 hypothetical protein [Micromonospora sp. 4G57]MDZ5494248.1 hypothetical protein [Micromonospora sp. 4G53]
MDAWVAGNVLAGDDALLDRYLDGFITVPEQLTGLVAALAEQAVSPEQAQRLFTVWPTILDRLLPGARHVPRPGDDRSYRRDEADLDKALLPKRPDVALWPGRKWLRGLGRWMDAYAPRPSLCDRLILCLGSMGLTFTPAGVQLIMRILGDDAARILRDSRYIAAWLRVAVLEQHENLEAQRLILRQLVDNLAAQGSTEATQIQRELEA